MSQSASPSPPKPSHSTTDAATEILSGQSKKGALARLMPFLGPAFIASQIIVKKFDVTQ